MDRLARALDGEPNMGAVTGKLPSRILSAGIGESDEQTVTARFSIEGCPMASLGR